LPPNTDISQPNIIIGIMVSKVITLKEVLELIKSYDKIFLFFHELPDCDALGSC
jgi:hypothetical protein